MLFFISHSAEDIFSKPKGKSQWYPETIGEGWPYKVPAQSKCWTLEVHKALEVPTGFELAKEVLCCCSGHRS
jgi:hypothetical protein